MSRPPTVALSICVCSSRPSDVRASLACWTAALGREDDLVVLFDTPSEELLEHTLPPRCEVVWLGATRGLSAARMAALTLAPSRFVLFVDDDATFTGATLDGVRSALYGGAHVAGVRLVASFEHGCRPWYLTDGLLHYVGVHSPKTLGSIWGACFAVDRDFVRAHGIVFRPELGRTDRRLQSGDDTTFVRDVRRHGGVTVLLEDQVAVHRIGPAKRRLWYLLRRAWWQGRSEVRRGDWSCGLAKELRRLTDGSAVSMTACIVVIFGGVVLAGIVTELCARITAPNQWVGLKADDPDQDEPVYGADGPLALIPSDAP